MTEWIKCSDRMPEEGAEALIYGVSYGQPFTCVAQRSRSYFGVMSWGVCGVSGYDYENDFDQDDVTHWQPLPAPPEVE